MAEDDLALLTHQASLLRAGIHSRRPAAVYQKPKHLFHWLHAKCGSRVRNRYYYPACNVVVEPDDLMRGYESAKDQYVRFTEAELETLETEASKSIDLKGFITAVQDRSGLL